MVSTHAIQVCLPFSVQLLAADRPDRLASDHIAGTLEHGRGQGFYRSCITLEHRRELQHLHLQS